MRILAIDPGSEQSAWVGYKEGVIDYSGLWDNSEVALFLLHDARFNYDHLAIEYTKAYTLQLKGRSRSFFPQQVLDTAKWVGRFEQAFLNVEHSPPPEITFTEVDRRQVKKALGVPPNGTDAHIKAALIDRYGGQTKAIGGVKCKKCKGKGWFGAGRLVCPQCGGKCWLHEPGPLWTLAKTGKDLWAALAVAVTYSDSLTERTT